MIATDGAALAEVTIDGLELADTVMQANDPFESPKLLLEAACADIDEFGKQCDAFSQSCIGVAKKSIDKKREEKVLSFRVEQRIPASVRILSSNAINNLRHALDHTVNCAALELGATHPDGYFPFAKSEKDLDRVIKRNCKSVPPSLLPLLIAYRPYGGGDEDLYRLTRLAGKNKHQMMLKIDGGLTSFILNGMICEVRGLHQLGFLKWDGDRQELEVARVGYDGDVLFYPQAPLPLRVFFADLQTGEPAHQYLMRMLDKIRSMVSDIVGETLRLKAL